jgi:hypothetical protein
MTLEKPTDESQQRLALFLETSGLAARGARVEPLANDASERRYFRLNVSGLSSRIVALYPKPVGNSLQTFTSITKLLRTMSVPVPRVITRVDKLGILVLEDLGDMSLQAHLKQATSAERDARYREAMRLILTLQRSGGALSSPAYPPYGLVFDQEKFMWELDFFTTHFLEGYAGVALPPKTRLEIRAEYSALAKELVAEPRVLCHRDYHSRNLMVHRDRLYLIDFQDARMGPDTYDLVSLLHDAYVDISVEETKTFTALFLDMRADAEGVTVDTKTRLEFQRRFDRMSVQRTLKALGTFGYQASAQNNPAYLAYVPRTIAHTRTSLAAWGSGARLRLLLAEFIPELG